MGQPRTQRVRLAHPQIRLRALPVILSDNFPLEMLTSPHLLIDATAAARVPEIEWCLGGVTIDDLSSAVNQSADTFGPGLRPMPPILRDGDFTAICGRFGAQIQVVARGSGQAAKT